MAPDFFEVGLSENALDYFLPYRTSLNLYEVMAKTSLGQGHVEEVKEMVQS